MTRAERLKARIQSEREAARRQERLERFRAERLSEERKLRREEERREERRADQLRAKRREELLANLLERRRLEYRSTARPEPKNYELAPQNDAKPDRRGKLREELRTGKSVPVREHRHEQPASKTNRPSAETRVRWKPRPLPRILSAKPRASGEVSQRRSDSRRPRKGLWDSLRSRLRRESPKAGVRARPEGTNPQSPRRASLPRLVAERFSRKTIEKLARRIESLRDHNPKAPPVRPLSKERHKSHALSIRVKLKLNELRSRGPKGGSPRHARPQRTKAKSAFRMPKVQGIRDTFRAFLARQGRWMRARLFVQSGSMPDSAPELPPGDPLWLSTEGNTIVDQNGYAVDLRGVTVAGLDRVAPGPDQSVAEALSLDDANLSVMTETWGMNLVRVPFHARTALEGNEALSPDEVLSGIDNIVEKVAGYNAYTLLALQAPVVSGAATLPDASVFECWRLLADRYQSQPAVLYEIYSASLPIAGDWLGTAPRLVGVIRRENPASLLFLGNGGGDEDIAGLPLRFTTGEPIFNLVYTVRVSPRPLQASFDAAFQGFADSYPIFVPEWTAAGPDLERVQELAASEFASYGLGWAASNWNAEPRLVANSLKHDFTLTRSGSVVRRAMALPTKVRFPPYLRSFRPLVEFRNPEY